MKKLFKDQFWTFRIGLFLGLFLVTASGAWADDSNWYDSLKNIPNFETCSIFNEGTVFCDRTSYKYHSGNWSMYVIFEKDNSRFFLNTDGRTLDECVKQIHALYKEVIKHDMENDR